MGCSLSSVVSGGLQFEVVVAIDSCLPSFRLEVITFHFRGGLDPLQQTKGKTEIAIHPGSDGHRPSGVVEALASVPIEGISIRFKPITRKAGWNAVGCDAHSTSALRQDMIYGFRRIATVYTTFFGIIV